MIRPRGIRRAADEVEASLGPVQLLFNTAGVSIFGPLQNATFEDWEWQLDVNLWGMINGIQIFVPRMLERGDDCHIINTSSMSAFVSLPGTGIYATTKMAVRGLSECLSMDLASIIYLGITFGLFVIVGLIVIRTYSKKNKDKAEVAKYNMLDDD